MRILVFGIGGHSKVIIDILEKEGVHQIVGLVSHDGSPQTFKHGYKVVASNDDFEDVIKELSIEGGIIALGSNLDRQNLVSLVTGKLQFVKAIHPSACIDKSAEIGNGSVIMAGTVVNAEVKIGAHCIVNTGAIIDHECCLGDFTHVCPGAILTGHVSVGNSCFLGAGSVVIDHLSLANDVIVGAGAVVTNNVAPCQKIIGIPGKGRNAKG